MDGNIKMNTQKIEGILVVRNSDDQIIAVFNRLEGEQKYEICTTSVASVEEVQSLLENKQEPKI
jgi:hypothetical protein